ncbi:MAG: hypothetical protein NVS9B8_07550 [Candidatus Limnocylindrales bacterium]
MTVLPFLALALIFGTASLLVRSQRGWSTAIAGLGLVAMAAAATTIGASTATQIGGAAIGGSEWLRLYALLGCVVGLLLIAVDVGAGHELEVPAVVVLGLGAGVLAIALADPRIAVVAATVGGLAGILVAAPVAAAARAAFVGARELRALAVTGALAIVATALLARPVDSPTGTPAVLGLAYLGVALAVAIRFGAIPFHLWAARVADSAPGASLPLLMAWGPAALAAVALVWIERSVAPVAPPLSGERAVVAAIGAVSIVFGTVAAWIQDDLEHVVGYTIVAEAGFVVLGLAVFDPTVSEPLRIWLLVFVVGRSAFAAWAVAIRGGFGTRRLPELGGWARRAPALALALPVIAIAAVGVPALGGWQARATIASLALPDFLAVAVMAAPVASLAIYGRILRIGFGDVGPAVRDGRGERPAWPEPTVARSRSGRAGTEHAVARGARGRAAGLDAVRMLPAAAGRNRMPLGSLAVFILAALAFAVSAGGLGVPHAARAAAIGAAGPSLDPRASRGPAGSADAGDTAVPSPPAQLTFAPVDGAPSRLPSGG